MGRLFGTDGIRGLANRHPITPDLVLQLGRALGEVIALKPPPSRVVIGRDTRLSGPMLEGALIAGLCSAGATVHRAGILPTPAVALLTRQLGASAGAVVSASHNAFPDNGIKLFGGDGFKIADEDEEKIESLILDEASAREPRTGNDIGGCVAIADANERYVDSLCVSLADRNALRGMRIVLDCANGAAVTVGPQLFETVGASLDVLSASPDGVNINVDAGALHPDRLRRAVVEKGAALGVALDGDADRLILVDERGEVADGDDIIGILAADHQARGALRVPRVVATVMTNMGLEVFLRGLGIALARTPVGDRHVVEEMRRVGAQIGGEPSGHVIVLDHSTTGDGLLAALQVAEVMGRTGRSLAELKQPIAKMPQVTVNIRVARRVDLATLASLQDAVREVEAALHDRGRVLIRYSGTEPLVRVMVEGEIEVAVKAHAQRLADEVRQAIGQG